MAKIYTKTGDRGETGLFGGPRVPKDDLRIEAYGTVDELNSMLGVIRSGNPPEAIDQLICRIQNELFDVGAELATPDAANRGIQGIGEDQIAAIEAEIDRYDAQLPPLQRFILPGGIVSAAQLHLARTICRRAERQVVSLTRRDESQISTPILVYLNRLSDLLFVLARAVNWLDGTPDVPWQAGGRAAGG